MNQFDPNEPSSKGLFIPNKQLSWVVSCSIMFVFMTGITGFFLGKRSAIEKFSVEVEQEAFSDQIYAQVTSQGSTTHTTVAESFVAKSEKEIELSENEQSTDNKNEQNEIVSAEQIDTTNQQTYYAQLIGFGTERAAQAFVRKVKNASVKVNQRRSKTPKGRSISWYQVVTEPYSDLNELQHIVDRISKQEKLKDVRIITC